MQKASSSSGASLDMVQLRSNHRLRAMPVPQTLVVLRCTCAIETARATTFVALAVRFCPALNTRREGWRLRDVCTTLYGRDQPRCLCFQSVLMQVSDESCPQRNHLSSTKDINASWLHGLRTCTAACMGMIKALSPKPYTLIISNNQFIRLETLNSKS